ncbi:MAG: AGE family epimerase/isomerase, partial [Chloroflexi bacterium]|nr:AGE family epimerase/isomerase [Chloroflexota bacterium]
YRDAALRTFDYLRAALYDAERGVFFGSQDADEHYYSLPMDERAKIRPPYVDKTIYTNWNATMVSAALEAARILGDPSYQDLALKALDFLWREMHDDQTGAMFHYMFHYYDGLPHLTGLLVDQVYVARAFLDAHESTGEKDYLDRAMELAQFIETRLRDKVAGGFFDLPEGHERLGVLAERHKSLPQNAVAAEVFLRLYYLTGAAEYGTAAEATLRCFADDYPRFRLFAATYAMAVQRFLNFPTQITIVSGAGDKRARELLGAALGIYDPTKIVQMLDPATDQERLGQLGYPPMPTPLAYVCVGRTCARPTDKPGEIGERVRQLVSPQG